MLVDAQDVRGRSDYQAIILRNSFEEACVMLRRQLRRESKSYTETRRES